MKENQILNGELAEAVNERDRHQSDLKECDKQIHILNEVIANKDREKDQIFTAYRKLIAEHDRLEVAHRSSVEDTNTLRMEIILRDKRIVAIQKSLDDASRDVTQMKIDLVAFEKQCSSLTRTIATYERNARHFESEKARLSREISVAQELAATLDRGREEIQKKFGALMVDHERLGKELRSSISERDVLSNQLREESEKRDRLETVISAERSQRVKLERSKTELEARASALESRLAAASVGQDGSAAVARRAWMKAEDEKKGLVVRVKEVEEEMRRKCEEYEKRCFELDVQVKNLNLLLDERRQESQRLHEAAEEERSHTPQPGDANDPLERRILEELESTKKQLKTFEAQIEERYREAGRG
ncbi:hypothetical protein HDU67_002326 [Dinochytrium kinnereticum]|nr:hypothetical protein HDU67_002326 [Dinochytrium kinnereticum]